MIIFNGIKNINKDVSVIKFLNSSGNSVEIPVTKAVADLISLHLNKISKEPEQQGDCDS